MEEVFTDYFDEFTKKHWDKIKAGLELNGYTGRNPAGRNQKAEPETGRIDGRNRGKKHAADYPRLHHRHQ